MTEVLHNSELTCRTLFASSTQEFRLRELQFDEQVEQLSFPRGQSHFGFDGEES